MSDDPTDEERAEIERWSEQFVKDVEDRRAAQIREMRKAYAAGQADGRAASNPHTNKAVIEKYYRRRARNPKLTLRQHLRDIGEESRETNIRVAKVRYDKRRKRGKKG